METHATMQHTYSARLGALALVILATTAACNKAEPAPALTAASPPAPTRPSSLGASAGGPGSGATGASAPQAGPTTAGSTLGASAGGDLAKLDLTKTASPPLAAKVDLASIPEVKATAMAMRSLTAIETTGFRVAYHPSSNSVHEGLRSTFAEHRLFEKVAEALNQTIRLPTTMDIHLVDCGTVNAFYDPEHKRIIVCYELITYFAELFRPTVSNEDELGASVIGATFFSFFHELGHGLIHLLELPTVGREEDAADQIATLILMADGDDGVKLALYGAYWFQLQDQAGTGKTPFWDEHAFDGQRYYNVLCLIYGSEPAKYAQFVSSGALPEARAQRCTAEHAQLKRSWDKLLEPHLTSAAAENIDLEPAAPAPEPGPDTGQDTDGKGGPVATPASGSVPTCEVLAQKAGEVIAAMWMAQLAELPPDQVGPAAANVHAQVPALLESLLHECRTMDWSAKVRACVLNASTVPELERCDVE